MISKMKNSIMNYAWGDPDAIPGLLGQANPEGKPFAEMWMGAHPKSPSLLTLEEGEIALDQWMKENADFSGKKLPYLLKLLAAGAPLSIQLHPGKKQAEEGFAYEEIHGPSLDSANRNFKDDNHKPEIMMALTPFTGLCGFRKWEVIQQDLKILEKEMAGETRLRSLFSAVEYRSLLDALYALPRDADLYASINEVAARLEGESFAWLGELYRHYSEDPGILFALILHIVHLEPYEALFIPAGVLHAYLKGFGVELMANSDNVIRGGLTVKHMEVELLKELMVFEAIKPHRVKPVEEKKGCFAYPVPVADFQLFSYRGSLKIDVLAASMPEIILCLEGETVVKQGESSVNLKPGESCLVTPGKKARLEVKGRAVRASG